MLNPADLANLLAIRFERRETTVAAEFVRTAGEIYRQWVTAQSVKFTARQMASACGITQPHARTLLARMEEDKVVKRAGFCDRKPGEPRPAILWVRA